jgi:hypothetical protein
MRGIIAILAARNLYVDRLKCDISIILIILVECSIGHMELDVTNGEEKQRTHRFTKQRQWLAPTQQFGRQPQILRETMTAVNVPHRTESEWACLPKIQRPEL